MHFYDVIFRWKCLCNTHFNYIKNVKKQDDNPNNAESKKKSQEERIHFSLHNHGFGTQEVNTTKIIIPKIGVWKS